MRTTILLAGSLALATAAYGQASSDTSGRTVSPQQKHAYIEKAKAHNEREAAADAAFRAHHKRLAAQIAAAKKSGDTKRLASLNRLWAEDEAHLAKDAAEDRHNAAHIEDTYELRTKTK
jgi:hypothetical protein